MNSSRVAWQFIIQSPVHSFQLSLYLSPSTFDGICMSICVRGNKIVQVIHSDMIEPAVIQDVIWHKFIRVDCCSW